MKKYILEILLIICTIIPFVYLASIFKLLPEQVPTHFGLDGSANGWSAKSSLWIMPAGLGLIFYLGMVLIPILDPKKKIALMGGKYGQLRAIIAIFFSLLSIYLIYISSGENLNNPNILIALLGLLFLLLGNYLQAVRANYFFGIRSPWALESESVWKKTHKLGGRLWMGGGLLIMLLCCFIHNNKLLAFMFFTIVVSMSIIPYVYSYFEFRRERSRIN